jgi:hypothetical protein
MFITLSLISIQSVISFTPTNLSFLVGSAIYSVSYQHIDNSTRFGTQIQINNYLKYIDHHIAHNLLYCNFHAQTALPFDKIRLTLNYTSNYLPNQT